jgi:EpsI family protein
MNVSGALRFSLAAGLIACTAVLLHARGRTEIIPQHLPLAAFPQQLGNWIGTDIALDKDTLAVLGKGDFMERVYQSPSGNLPEIDLFLAYFASQRAGDTIHSPQHCLPGAGWNPDQKQLITLSLPGHAAFPANQYVISKAESRRLVLYWYWAHNRGVASEYWAKFYLVKDAIRMNRSDGALVRITISMLPGETAEAAERRVLPFAAQVVPLLNEYIPR